jgi:CheY-like chemotaxis protein
MIMAENESTDAASANLNTNWILLVEDQEDHAEMVRRNLPKGWECQHLENAADAIDWLSQAYHGTNGHGIPDLIFLDWRFDGQDQQGRDVLKCLKTHENSRALNLHRLPIVVLTTSDQPQDIAEAFGSYANSYLVKPKPGNIEGWRELLKDVIHYWHQLDLHELAKPKLPVKD